MTTLQLSSTVVLSATTRQDHTRLILTFLQASHRRQPWPLANERISLKLGPCLSPSGSLAIDPNKQICPKTSKKHVGAETSETSPEKTWPSQLFISHLLLLQQQSHYINGTGFNRPHSSPHQRRSQRCFHSLAGTANRRSWRCVVHPDLCEASLVWSRNGPRCGHLRRCHGAVMGWHGKIRSLSLWRIAIQIMQDEGYQKSPALMITNAYTKSI